MRTKLRWSLALAVIGAFSVSAADLDSLTERARASLKQARATDSAASLKEAEDAVHQALLASPDDFTARKLEVRMLLAQHRFREALEKAKPLNKAVPDDLECWGLISDAALGLGDYPEAERTAQWMLTLRSTNVGGLQRGARLRELFGDMEGAREFWEAALRLSLADQEERAWIGTQIASLLRRTGHADQAEGMIGQVLKAVPGYQPALAEMARIRMGQHQYGEAVKLLEERYKKVARPDVQYELACALQAAGREQDARGAFEQFARSARTTIDAPYNFNHELALYYAGPGGDAAEAVRIGKIEAARHQDVETLDAYAWALYSAGDLGESQKQMEKAMAVGVRDPAIVAHAEAIAAKRKAAAHAD